VSSFNTFCVEVQKATEEEYECFFLTKESLICFHVEQLSIRLPKSIYARELIFIPTKQKITPWYRVLIKI